MASKFIYTIRAIFTPTCWFRLGHTDRKWDRWLWNALENHEIRIVGYGSALIEDKKVWIENAPYANGFATSSAVSRDESRGCSRATALYLEEQIRRARRLQPSFTDDQKMHIFKEYGINKW